MLRFANILECDTHTHTTHIPLATDDSVANIFAFRTSKAAHGGDVENVFSEERFCETVSSINPDRIRSQTEALNSQVRHFDSSFPKAGPVDAAHRASIFQRRTMFLKCFHQRIIDFSV